MMAYARVRYELVNLQSANGAKPAWEEFTGSRWSFRDKPLMPWGTLLEVFIPKPHRTWKFGEKAFSAMYIIR